MDRATARAQAAAATTIPLWTHEIAVAGDPKSPYGFEMVGKDPFVAHANPVTTIAAPIVPVVFTIGSTVFDPTKADPACSPGGIPAHLVRQSPLLQPIHGNQWGSGVGLGQYVDDFQRANFWAQTGPAGINPGYHVVLKPVVLPAVTVPAGEMAKLGGTTLATPCGTVGEIEVTAWEIYLEDIVFQALDQQGAGPTTIPIVLFYNVVLYDQTTSNCCYLGYHTAFTDEAAGGTLHEYVVADFDTSRNFPGFADISALSHELAEWMDDPIGDNPTPPWGNVGQVQGACQSTLEAGDPLVGTLEQIYMPENGYTYHVQDLAFWHWFYRKPHSPSLNGWYSFQGNFLAAATPCD
jgi:hypothetical protein